MATLNELTAKIAAELDQIKQIESAAAEEKRELNESETSRIEALNETVDALIAERDELDRRVKARERAAQNRERFEQGIERKVGKTAVTSRVHDRREDDPKRGFAHVGDFATAVQRSSMNNGFMDERLLIGAAATGASYGDGSSLGFLVPPEFSTSIWDGMNSMADSLLARTNNYTVTGESLTFPANAETSRATGSRFGGVQAYWISEAQQITSSKPKLRNIKLEPQQLAVLIYATDKLLNNASAAEQYIRTAATEEIDFLVGDAIVNGDGIGKPTGLLNSGALVTVSKETSQAADTIVHQNIVKMRARIHPRRRANLVWLANIDCEPELMNLFLPVTNVAGTENVGGRDQRLYNPETGMLLGRPVIFTEYNATLGTVGDLICVDLGAYVTGTRGGVDTAMSMHLRFDYAETAFRFMFEVDGQTWLQSAITPFKGTNTLTSVVALETR